MAIDDVEGIYPPEPLSTEGLKALQEMQEILSGFEGAYQVALYDQARIEYNIIDQLQQNPDMAANLGISAGPDGNFTRAPQAMDVDGTTMRVDIKNDVPSFSQF